MTPTGRWAVVVVCAGVAAAVWFTRTGSAAPAPATTTATASATASGTSTATAPATAKFEPAKGTAYLGVSTDLSRLDVFDTAAGITTHPAIYNQWTPPDGSVAPTLSNAATMPGMTPMVSWNLPLSDGTVTSGERDDYLRAQADAVKTFGKPVFVRLDWEMNGTWYPEWNAPAVPASAFVAAWRHVYEVFQSEGVTNAAFVWCVNVWRGPDNTENSAWYPGDGYVDWVGVDGYPQSSASDYLLNGPDGLNAMAAFAAGHNKPLMLAEWAPQLPPPDTAAPVDLILDWAAAHPDTVKALVYFDFVVGAKDFQLVDHAVGAAELRRRTQFDPSYLDTVVGATG